MYVFNTYILYHDERHAARSSPCIEVEIPEFRNGMQDKTGNNGDGELSAARYEDGELSAHTTETGSYQLRAMKTGNYQLRAAPDFDPRPGH